MPNLPKRTARPWIQTRKPQTGRKKPNQKFYNSALWRKTAKAIEAETPTCIKCGKDATGRKGVTDHITPINKGGAMYDRTNLQRMCNRCHNRKSQSER